MRIFKFAFWMMVVVVFLPASNDNEPGKGQQNQTSIVNSSEMAVAAASLSGDITSFCDAQPVVCQTGAAAFELFKAKAATGLTIVAPWNQAPEETKSEMIHAQTNALPVKRPKLANSETSSNTLKLDDLVPEWKSPKKATSRS